MVISLLIQMFAHSETNYQPRYDGVSILQFSGFLKLNSTEHVSLVKVFFFLTQSKW